MYFQNRNLELEVKVNKLTNDYEELKKGLPESSRIQVLEKAKVELEHELEVVKVSNLLTLLVISNNNCVPTPLSSEITTFSTLYNGHLQFIESNTYEIIFFLNDVHLLVSCLLLKFLLLFNSKQAELH